MEIPPAAPWHTATRSRSARPRRQAGRGTDRQVDGYVVQLDGQAGRKVGRWVDS